MHSLLTEEFRAIIYEYYDHHGRHDLAWRQSEPNGSFDPYKILVSELMLQQTQVSRVTPKYQEFLSSFPTLDSLAQASLGNVLKAWSGLGYNRRAQYLHRAARQITEAYDGKFPATIESLITLPGVGHNTAGAVLAYAFNLPTVFIETNIRTVYIHFFFPDMELVSDHDITSLVEQTLDHENPRYWYWALMDYGSYLKHDVGNVGRISRVYTKQSKFEGSRRQVRGQVIRQLKSGSQDFKQLQHDIVDDRLASVLEQLVSEGLIQKNGHIFSL
jgi:A/G-specific adenine glycosylase